MVPLTRACLCVCVCVCVFPTSDVASICGCFCDSGNAFKGFHGKHSVKKKTKQNKTKKQQKQHESVVAAKEVFTCCLTPVKSDPASDAY